MTCINSLNLHNNREHAPLHCHLPRDTQNKECVLTSETKYTKFRTQRMLQALEAEKHIRMTVKPIIMHAEIDNYREFNSYTTTMSF